MSDENEVNELPFVGKPDDLIIPTPAESRKICSEFWGDEYHGQTGPLRMLTYAQYDAMSDAEKARVEPRIAQCLEKLKGAFKDPSRFPMAYIGGVQNNKLDDRVIFWDARYNPDGYTADQTAEQFFAKIALWSQHNNMDTASDLGKIIETFGIPQENILNWFKSFRPHTGPNWGSVNHFNGAAKS